VQVRGSVQDAANDRALTHFGMTFRPGDLTRVPVRVPFFCPRGARRLFKRDRPECFYSRRGGHKAIRRLCLAFSHDWPSITCAPHGLP